VPETDEWPLHEVVGADESGSMDIVGSRPVTIDGREVDATRVMMRRRSGGFAWLAYVDGDPLRPGAVIRYGETVVHVQPHGS
jgi:hypothetical protein